MVVVSCPFSSVFISKELGEERKNGNFTNLKIFPHYVRTHWCERFAPAGLVSFLRPYCTNNAYSACVSFQGVYLLSEELFPLFFVPLLLPHPQSPAQYLAFAVS